jgi:hypothetical protein
MKRHVLEIASDAKTLEEKLNGLGEHLAFETMVWANGKLFVVVREYLPRAAESEPSPKHEGRWPRRKQRGKNRDGDLPKQGELLRKDKQ